MHPLLIWHSPTSANACPRFLKAAESYQRVIEQQTSSSSAGGGVAGPGKRSVASAFAVRKVHTAPVKDSLGRWIYAEKVPPSAFDHRSWPAVFAVLKTVPNFMPAPRRYHLAGRILDGIGDSDSRRPSP